MLINMDKLARSWKYMHLMPGVSWFKLAVPLAYQKALDDFLPTDVFLKLLKEAKADRQKFIAGRQKLSPVSCMTERPRQLMSRFHQIEDVAEAKATL